MSYSKGNLIFCLDADNILQENTVGLLIKHLYKTGSDIVAFEGIKYFQDRGNEKEILTELIFKTDSGFFTLKDLLVPDITPPCSGNYLFKKSNFMKIGGYPENMGALDTFTFGFLQVAQGGKLSYAPGTFYWHRQGIESYYIRDLKSQKLDKLFYTFMVNNRHLFTDRTNKTFLRCLKRLNEGKAAPSYCRILDSGRVELRS